MATRNIVPRATGEGSLGTETKIWGNIYADNLHLSNPLPIANGGTGASTAEQARTNLGLGNVSTLNTVPIANGGTGATTAKQARANLEVEPIGTIFAFAGNDIPSGYLPCNGSAISRTTYADLFAVIGTTYGSGDGSTTFTLPNLIDRFIEGSSAAGNYYSAGLPNLTGTVVDIYGNYDSGIAVDGNSFKGTLSGYRESVKNGGNEWQERNYDGFNFNASWANTIYGASSTVQPPALTMRYIIKY